MPGFMPRIHVFFPGQDKPSYCSIDKPGCRNYLYAMNIIRRTLEIDAGTDARLTEMAAERGQDDV
jgi:hypothetical protein